MSSKFFIERPIFAAVLSIVIVLAGLVALRILPIAQYPEIVPPTVTITATYPGASAETLARTVAAPIEEQLSGIEGLQYFSSSASSNGTVEIITHPDQLLYPNRQNTRERFGVLGPFQTEEECQ